MDEDVGFTSSYLEMLKVILVLQTEFSLWPVETAEDVGIVIARITKAVAAIQVRAQSAVAFIAAHHQLYHT